MADLRDFVISSLKGGQNDADSPLALPDDQCVLVRNVEFRDSMLGERRRGSAAIDLTGAGVAAEDAVVFLHRHTPSLEAAEAELWAVGVTGAATATISRKTTTWADVTPVDALDLTEDFPYRLQGVSFAGLLFLAYKSAVNRLHVWDGSSLRRSGLEQPVAAPTAVDTAVAGAYVGVRVFRVRFIKMTGAVIDLRSEPSAELTFTPNGSFNGAIITRPAALGESETHWEVEESDGSGNFYRIATVVLATTTYTDTILADLLVPDNGVLSDDIGDYALLPSAEFLAVDENRLLLGGDYEDTGASARVRYTSVVNDPTGVGNSERVPLDIDDRDLDVFDGGRLTGLSNPINGSIIATKVRQIHKLVRTGDRTDPYESVPITKSRGALRGSLVESVDQQGQPAVYMLDQEVGPLRYGAGGLMRAGADIFKTWQTVNLDASKIVCWGMAYPSAEQVHWWVATGENETPSLRLVLHTNLTREAEDGIRRGIVTWDGLTAQALCGCLFSTNVDAGAARNSTLVPFLGFTGEGLIHRTDTGSDDNGDAYTATIRSRPYAPTRGLDEMGVMAGVLIGDAVASAMVDIAIEGNFGLNNKTDIDPVDFTPVGAESLVIRTLDNLSLSELRTAQFVFSDPETPGPRWALQMFAMRPRSERKAAG